MAKKIRVLFQGTMDLLHFGQIKAMQRAKKQGGYLIIALNTDKLVQKYKDRLAIIPYKYRKKMLEALECVDKVVPARYFSPLNILKKEKIDVYVICDEWKDTKKAEIKYMKDKGGKTHILPYLKTISATQIRAKITQNYLLHSVKLCKKCHKKV